jgi:hypothetical protein
MNASLIAPRKRPESEKDAASPHFLDPSVLGSAHDGLGSPFPCLKHHQCKVLDLKVVRINVGSGL